VSNGQQRLKLHVETGETRIDIEGDPDTVSREFLRQLAEVYPALELAKRLTYAPDIAKLSESLVGILEFASEGILLNRRDLSAEQAILVCLLGGFVGYRIGRRDADYMSASTLSKASGKAVKTISNQLALMVDEGLVEKLGKGDHRITSHGIKKAEAVAGGLR
jgi:hypothetical protein